MAVRRKVFRIEQMAHDDSAGHLLHALPISRSERQEILAELKACQAACGNPQSNADDGVGSTSSCRPKSEAATFQRALDQARHALATLRGLDRGPASTRMARELDAVAGDSERATQQILDAAEAIEDAAKTLAASLRREQEQALALDIRDAVLRIFEACNFQDLAGQRIAKVQASLQAIAAVGAGAATMPAVGDTRLHGPRLAGDEGHVTQADVDALFGR